MPSSDRVGEIAAFGDRQTGQLDKANADKAGAKEFIAVCDEAQQQAVENAKKKTRKRFLGLL